MPGRVTRAVRRAVRRAGLDVVRYPPREPRPTSRPKPAAVRPEYAAQWTDVVRLVERLGCTVVVDVGANQGQYARGLRACGYAGPILSFEPVSAAFDVAREAAVADPAWTVERCALGSSPGTATINVAANKAQSSSLLGMLERHRTAAPHATYVGTEEVDVRRLDDVLGDRLADERVLLKIDTQGFECEVLRGGAALLAGPVQAVQAELSVVPLYDGAPLYLDVVALLAEHGFRLAEVLPGYRDPATGEMLQFDGTFVRES